WSEEPRILVQNSLKMPTRKYRHNGTCAILVKNLRRRGLRSLLVCCSVVHASPFPGLHCTGLGCVTHRRRLRCCDDTLSAHSATLFPLHSEKNPTDNRQRKHWRYTSTAREFASRRSPTPPAALGRSCITTRSRPLGDISRYFEELLNSNNPRKRGSKFEHLIAMALEDERYQVLRNPKSAKPRQTDLFASDYKCSYLFETKWMIREINVADIVQLRDRLNRAP